ncbi:MAG: 30S ribosomal protein S20 [Chlamydiales bacterium]|nr:30S ribosomal protein S20 [Chlamydiales bacterium]
MAKEEKDKKAVKEKAPTALKRQKQSEESRLRNRTFKAKVRTAIRSYETTLGEKNKEESVKALNVLYSLFDKGVKKGIFKKNKANRSKSRLTVKSASV